MSQGGSKLKEIFGVKKEIFQQMLDILTADREKLRQKGEPRPMLCVGDQLLVTVLGRNAAGGYSSLEAGLKITFTPSIGFLST